MSWLKDNPLAKAFVEHVLRGGLAALVAAYLAGQIHFDGTVNVQQLGAWASIFIGGCITSFLVSLGIQMKTGTGPSLNSAESFQTARSVRRRNQRGVAELTVIAVCAITVTVVALLWLLGVHPNH